MQWLKRKDEFNQETNVKKLKTEGNQLNNVANVAFTVRQIESLEKMAMLKYNTVLREIGSTAWPNLGGYRDELF